MLMCWATMQPAACSLDVRCMSEWSLHATLGRGGLLLFSQRHGLTIWPTDLTAWYTVMNS